MVYLSWKSAWRKALFAAVLFAASLVIARSAVAVDVTSFQGALRGFPALRDLSGRTLAKGDFAQWFEGGRLHVKLTYRFTGERRTVEETAEFKQERKLVQEQWSNRELINGQVSRRFSVDFVSGRATAEKRENGELKRWSKTVKVTPGRTFAGVGFMLATINLRDRLIKGEKIELKAIGFAPEPRVVAVQIFHAGLDQMRMARSNA
jgi:hypothetical protein